MAMLNKIFTFLMPTKSPTEAQGDEITIARAKRQMERNLRAAGHSRKGAVKATVEHFAKRLKEH
jgi:hypothetical protein